MPYPKSRRNKAQGCLPEVGAGPRPGEFSRFVNTWDCWRIKISLEDIVELQYNVGYCIYLNTYLSLIPMDKKNIYFFFLLPLLGVAVKVLSSSCFPLVIAVQQGEWR